MKKLDYNKIKKYFFLRNYINFLKDRFGKQYQISYSQCGEDIIISYIFRQLKINNPTYLDLGAHHPYYLSNTYYFYKRKSVGVCVEPDSKLLQYIKKKRPKDVCLNYGAGFSSKKEVANFYIMSAKALHTFSKEEADRLVREEGLQIVEVRKVQLIPINDIISNNFKDKPNLISLDTEGLDLEILKSIDFKKYRPEIFCVETTTYTKNGEPEKQYDTIDFMKEKDYFVYADTFINTIFVDKSAWLNRHK